MSPRFHVILRLQEPQGENDELGRRSLQPLIVELFDAISGATASPICNADRKPQCGKISGAKAPEFVGSLRTRDIDKLSWSSKLKS